MGILQSGVIIMLTIFFRVVLLYTFSVIAMRLMGKRQVGQLQPYELVLALMVAEIAAAPMENMATPMLHGLVPILGLLVLHGVCTALALKSQTLRQLMYGIPGVVIREGVVDGRQMKRMAYTVTDLLEELRGQGYEDVSHIHTAILETNGKLSVFPKAAFAPVTCRDLQLKTEPMQMPLLLIADGAVQQKHLLACGRNEAWLLQQLSRVHIHSVKQVLLASLNGQGELFVQGKKQPVSHILQTGGAA